MYQIETDDLGTGAPPHDTREDPLDGSVSGTIGGGGAESGGPSRRPPAADTPPVKSENAASGRLASNPNAATAEPDEFGRRPSDVNAGNDPLRER
jgi:hypothetical protein